VVWQESGIAVVLLAAAAVVDFAEGGRLRVIIGIGFAVAAVLFAFNALRLGRGGRPGDRS